MKNQYLLSATILSLLVLHSSLTYAQRTFDTKVDYATGGAPYSVAIGDLNGDGKPDLAVVNGNSNTVSILTNTGTGSFGSNVDYATGSYPVSVAIGDLNGDGKLDLAVANLFSNTVSVFTNTGAGSFGSRVDYGTGSHPISVAIGDLNGDTKPDLAIANERDFTVSVLTNTGTDSFGSKVDYATGSYPHGLAIGDLNGDGKPDLAVANGGGSTVSVFTNTGTGSFGNKVDYATGYGPYSVAIGDLNGDGKADLALSNRSIVSVLTNTGTGSFGSKADYDAGLIPVGVAIGDLNGDSKLDLVIANDFSNTVSVLTNTGTGSFGSRVVYATGRSPESVAIGDLNGDGKPDLAVPNLIDNKVSVLLAKDAQQITIISLIPSVFSPTNVVTISGTGLANITTVSFPHAVLNQNVDVTPISVSATQILIVVPFNIKTGVLTVTGGMGSATATYTYQPQQYGIGLISPVEDCSSNKFNIPITVSTIPSGVIGLAINIPYDPSLIYPTGVITYGSVLTVTGAPLLNASFNNTIAGQVIDVINIYANFGYTGDIAAGSGKIADIEFALKPGISPQQITVSGSTFESYETFSTDVYTVSSGIIPIIANDQQKITGTLLARGSTNRPITSFGIVKTVLYGATGATLSPSGIQTLSGNTFSTSLPAIYDGLGIVRTIPTGTIVTPVINSADASLVQKIANNLPPYNTTVPSVLQLMAADVNSDNRVALADWILIQQRVVNTIQSFPNTPDWKFIESFLVNTFTGQTNTNFPLAKSIVPVSPINNANGCTTLGDRTITGILTGDVDGTWNNVTNGATFRQDENMELVYKTSEGVYVAEDEIKFPVYVSNASVAVDAIDVDVNYDQTQINIAKVEPYVTEKNSTIYNIYNGNRLLVSSLSYETFNSDKPVLYLTFKGQTALTESYFHTINSYVNGVNVNSRLEGISASSGTNVAVNSALFKLFPNPSDNGVFNLNQLGKGNKSIKVSDLTGKVLYSTTTTAELYFELNLSGFNAGMYVLELTGAEGKIYRKLEVR